MKMLRYESNVYASTVPYLTLFTSGGTYLYNSPATGRGNNGLNVPPLRELCRKLLSGMDTYLTYLRDGYPRGLFAFHSISISSPFQKSTLGTQSLNQVFS